MDLRYKKRGLDVSFKRKTEREDKVYVEFELICKTS